MWRLAREVFKDARNRSFSASCTERSADLIQRIDAAFLPPLPSNAHAGEINVLRLIAGGGVVSVQWPATSRRMRRRIGSRLATFSPFASLKRLLH
jgi:hypothetical protein